MSDEQPQGTIYTSGERALKQQLDKIEAQLAQLIQGQQRAARRSLSTPDGGER